MKLHLQRTHVTSQRAQLSRINLENFSGLPLSPAVISLSWQLNNWTIPKFTQFASKHFCASVNTFPNRLWTQYPEPILQHTYQPPHDWPSIYESKILCVHARQSIDYRAIVVWCILFFPLRSIPLWRGELRKPLNNRDAVRNVDKTFIFHGMQIQLVWRKRLPCLVAARHQRQCAEVCSCIFPHTSYFRPWWHSRGGVLKKKYDWEHRLFDLKGIQRRRE